MDIKADAAHPVAADATEAPKAASAEAWQTEVTMPSKRQIAIAKLERGPSAGPLQSASGRRAREIARRMDALEASTARWRQGVGEHLGNGLALQVDVGPRVTHRRVQAGMPQPLADGGEVHARLQQRNGRAVPQRVRVDALVAQAGYGLGCRLDIAA